MKTLWFIVFSLCALQLAAQPGNPSFRRYIVVDQLPSIDQIKGGSHEIAPDSAYFIGTDSIRVSGKIEVNAACRDGKIQGMQHAKARYHGDSLIVTLFRADPSAVHQLDIIISGKEFMTLYRLSPRDGSQPTEVVATDQVLVLKQPRFAKGQVLKGFVNFRGTNWEPKSPVHAWESKMDWVESEFCVRGPFRVLID